MSTGLGPTASTVDASMPTEIFHAGVALSSITDFSPILHCSENDGLQMDKADATAASTMLRKPVSTAPLLIGYGENEPPDMHRQSQELWARNTDEWPNFELMAVPGVEHFDILNRLAEPDSALFQRAHDLFTRGES